MPTPIPISTVRMTAPPLGSRFRGNDKEAGMPIGRDAYFPSAFSTSAPPGVRVFHSS
jgi:hypothetical protein